MHNTTSEHLDALLQALSAAKETAKRDEQTLKTLWTVIRLLVDLNDPKIDEVLHKFKVVVHHEGKQIFPRPPHILYDSTPN